MAYLSNGNGMKRHLFLCLLLISSTSGVCAEQTPFSSFWSVAETLHKIETKSFRTLPIATIIEEGLRAMVNKVDAHSAFFSPELYQDTVEFAAGHFPGIGVSTVSKETDADAIMVVDVVRGGPADSGGIQSGDTIIKIDGTKLRGLTSEEVINKLKGPIDTTVTVTVLRDKKPLKFTLTRKLIPDRSVFGYFFPTQQIAYVAIKSFSDKTRTHVARFISSAQEKNSAGIILDLRKNPGGVFEAAVKTAGLFLPEKSAVAHTKNNKQEIVSSTATSGTPLYTKNYPIIVLTDNFTASAGEILTGCLKHHARLLNLPIFVVGMPTFGKGSVQEIIPLQNGGALKLTTLLYYLPNDQCIQALGVAPDIVVKPKTVPSHELKWVEELYGKETALSNHITRAEVDATPVAVPTPPKSEQKSPKDMEEQFVRTITNDHVIQTALTLINVWQLGNKAEPEQLATHETALSFLNKQVITQAPAHETL